MAERPSHLRRPSAQRIHSLPNDALSLSLPASPYARTASTASTTPTLLRLPSTRSPQGRRATNPSSPLTPANADTSSTASPASSSYFGIQPTSAVPARSPGSKKPPAFFSGHGVDASQGPPNSLVTRGNVDIARRAPKPVDPDAVTPAKPVLVSPGPVVQIGASSPAETPSFSRRSSTQTVQQEPPMERSLNGSVGLRSVRSVSAEPEPKTTNWSFSSSEANGDEDLFIAAANAGRPHGVEAPSRAERLRSRIAIRSTRQSFPSTPQTSTASRTTADAGSAPQPRRTSNLLSSRMHKEQSPVTPASAIEMPRSRTFDISPKYNFSKPRDQDLSPHQFLSQLSQRRPSHPIDSTNTPSTRTPYKPSNLHYSSSKDHKVPRDETHPETVSRADGTESLDSTGPATSVWDELDDLKSRIRRIEIGGKIPATSGAAVTNASERPRTANTSITTISSSPKHLKKITVDTPPESTAGAQASGSRVHPLLKDALAKAKQHITPATYRILQATATEALALAEITGSHGPQGTLHSASSILTGGSLPERQVRRKADNICRSLTELCIELCDTKNVASPASRTLATSTSRRPSLPLNGDSPLIRTSIEPESDTLRSSAPSRAMSRIEARRTSVMTSKLNGTREFSLEPPTPSQTHFSFRVRRAGTSLNQTRHQTTDDEEEDEDDDTLRATLRAPSRALTDFRDIRNARSSQSRQFSNSHAPPLPDTKPTSTTFQYTPSPRRPTLSNSNNQENDPLSARDPTRRFTFDRQHTPSLEKRASVEFTSRLTQPTQYGANRRSADMVNTSEVLGRRRRGNSAAGE